jgi:hypothetical protein
MSVTTWRAAPMGAGTLTLLLASFALPGFAEDQPPPPAAGAPPAGAKTDAPKGGIDDYLSGGERPAQESSEYIWLDVKDKDLNDILRSISRQVGVNIIADPEWDRERFRVVREWCTEIPEVVNISVNTPYPGTETWYTESRKLATRDYRLFDIQHAVLPTRQPLPDFYTELVQTQQVLNRKHLGARQLWGMARVVTRLLAHGQTNFLKMLFKFNSVYDPRLQLADHQRPVKYEISLPPEPQTRLDATTLYIHKAQGRRGREIDNATEQFVEDTR